MSAESTNPEHTNPVNININTSQSKTHDPQVTKHPPRTIIPKAPLKPTEMQKENFQNSNLVNININTSRQTTHDSQPSQQNLQNTQTHHIPKDSHNTHDQECSPQSPENLWKALTQICGMHPDKNAIYASFDDESITSNNPNPQLPEFGIFAQDFPNNQNSLRESIQNFLKTHFKITRIGWKNKNTNDNKDTEQKENELSKDVYMNFLNEINELHKPKLFCDFMYAYHLLRILAFLTKIEKFRRNLPNKHVEEVYKQSVWSFPIVQTILDEASRKYGLVHLHITMEGGNGSEKYNVDEILLRIFEEENTITNANSSSVTNDANDSRDTISTHETDKLFILVEMLELYSKGILRRLFTLRFFYDNMTSNLEKTSLEELQTMYNEENEYLEQHSSVITSTSKDHTDFYVGEQVFLRSKHPTFNSKEGEIVNNDDPDNLIVKYETYDITNKIFGNSTKTASEKDKKFKVYKRNFDIQLYDYFHMLKLHTFSTPILKYDTDDTLCSKQTVQLYIAFAERLLEIVTYLFQLVKKNTVSTDLKSNTFMDIEDINTFEPHFRSFFESDNYNYDIKQETKQKIDTLLEEYRNRFVVKTKMHSKLSWYSKIFIYTYFGMKLVSKYFTTYAKEYKHLNTTDTQVFTIHVLGMPQKLRDETIRNPFDESQPTHVNGGGKYLPESINNVLPRAQMKRIYDFLYSGNERLNRKLQEHIEHKIWVLRNALNVFMTKPSYEKYMRMYAFQYGIEHAKNKFIRVGYSSERGEKLLVDLTETNDKTPSLRRGDALKITPRLKMPFLPGSLNTLKLNGKDVEVHDIIVDNTTFDYNIRIILKHKLAKPHRIYIPSKYDTLFKKNMDHRKELDIQIYNNRARKRFFSLISKYTLRDVPEPQQSSIFVKVSKQARTQVRKKIPAHIPGTEALNDLFNFHTYNVGKEMHAFFSRKLGTSERREKINEILIDIKTDIMESIQHNASLHVTKFGKKELFLIINDFIQVNYGYVDFLVFNGIGRRSTYVEIANAIYYELQESVKPIQKKQILTSSHKYQPSRASTLKVRSKKDMYGEKKRNTRNEILAAIGITTAISAEQISKPLPISTSLAFMGALAKLISTKSTGIHAVKTLVRLGQEIVANGSQFFSFFSQSVSIASVAGMTIPLVTIPLLGMFTIKKYKQLQSWMRDNTYSYITDVNEIYITLRYDPELQNFACVYEPDKKEPELIANNTDEGITAEINPNVSQSTDNTNTNDYTDITENKQRDDNTSILDEYRNELLRIQSSGKSKLASSLNELIQSIKNTQSNMPFVQELHKLATVS